MKRENLQRSARSACKRKESQETKGGRKGRRHE